MSKVKKINIDSDISGQRLDNFLINILKGVPKSKIYSIIRKGEIRVNSKRKKPSYKLLHGEAIASGIIIELYISHLTLGFPLEKVELCTKHINTLFPKVKLTNNEIMYLYDIMRFDKKNYKDNTNFVLLKDVGSCVTDQTAIKDSIDAGINYYLNN